MVLARRPRKVIRKRKFGRKGARKANSRRVLQKKPQYAVITETNRVATVAANTTYVEQVSIQSSVRALAVAKNFKFYRLKAVKYIYTPSFTVFQEGFSGSGAATRPYFFMVMNRTGESTVPSIAQMEEQGATPKPFSRDISISYRPNLTQAITIGSAAGNTQQVIGSRPIYGQWLATKESVSPTPNDELAPTIQHNHPYYQGHVWGIRALDGTTNTVGLLDVECVWEFKDPQEHTTNTVASFPGEPSIM